MDKKVYIVILNWNGWRDTIECLESVFCNEYPNFTVIVCDNYSSDDSLEKIKQWAAGKLPAKVSADLQRIVGSTPVVKPIDYIEYTREQAEQGGELVEPPLILIQTGANLGFAGGNNVGIRYAMARDNFEYVWLLNNDTVVNAKALVHLVNRMKVKPAAGMCGSTLLYYHQPDTVQAYGGATYNKWLGMPKNIGQKYSMKNPDEIEAKMDYVIGASMFVTKAFLTTIGLLNEEYFLYYEEMDWSVRAKNKFTLAYAPQSIIYHKEGASIGSNSNCNKKSWISDYYIIKNRIVFTKKYFRYCQLTVYLGLIITIINRIKRNQWDRVSMILKFLR